MQIGGKLDHPNIISLLDANVEQGWIVLEYAAGGSLEDKIADDPEWARANFLSLATDICDALIHAHSLHLIHRDLKPANILFTSEGRAKLADFGIARELSTGEKAQTTAGTVPYMAPEVLTGDDYDVDVDLHSLGVVLYEVLAGELPFPSRQLATLVLDKESAQYKRLSETTALKKQTIRIVDRLLASPHSRLRSAENLRAQLRQADPRVEIGNTIDDMQMQLAQIYGDRPANQSPIVVLALLNASLRGLTGGLVHPDREYGRAQAEKYFPRVFSWSSALHSSLNVRFSYTLWLKYQSGCPYCEKRVCECDSLIQGTDHERNTRLLERINARPAPTLIKARTFESYALELEDTYSHRDSTPSEMSWHAFSEVAEAMDALIRLPSLKVVDEVKILHLELADITAWFYALLRIYTEEVPGYFFVKEFDSVYADGCYKCASSPCECPDVPAELLMSNWRLS